MKSKVSACITPNISDLLSPVVTITLNPNLNRSLGISSSFILFINCRDSSGLFQKYRDKYRENEKKIYRAVKGQRTENIGII